MEQRKLHTRSKWTTNLPLEPGLTSWKLNIHVRRYFDMKFRRLSVDKYCRITSEHGWLTSESTMTWILNVDCVEHRRSFDDSMDQILEFRRQHGLLFEIFDHNIDQSQKFSTKTPTEVWVWVWVWKFWAMLSSNFWAMFSSKKNVETWINKVEKRWTWIVNVELVNPGSNPLWRLEVPTKMMPKSGEWTSWFKY